MTEQSPTLILSVSGTTREMIYVASVLGNNLQNRSGTRLGRNSKLLRDLLMGSNALGYKRRSKPSFAQHHLHGVRASDTMWFNIHSKDKFDAATLKQRETKKPQGASNQLVIG